MSGSEPKLAEVKTLFKANSTDIPAMLRRLADEIQSGNHGEIDRVACVVENEDGSPAVFGWGVREDHSDVLKIMGLLQLGVHHLAAMRNKR